MAADLIDAAALNALPWPVAVIARDERVRLLNGAAARWLGVQGQVKDLPQLCRGHPELLAAVRTALGGGAMRLLCLPGVCDEISYEVHLSYITGGAEEGDAVLLYASPVPSEVYSERLRRRQVLDRALDNISRLVFTQRDYRAILDGVVASIVNSEVADSAIIYVQHEGQWEARHLYGLPEELRGRRLPEREVKPSLRAIKRHQVVVINDTSASPDVTRTWVQRYRITSLIDVEITVPGTDMVDFAIHYHGPGGRKFDDQDVAFMERVSAAVTLALRNAQLVNALQDDIEKRRALEERIRHMAYHDALTGLPNRRLFSELLEFELAQARRERRRVAVMYFDLDRFKDTNDTLGHDVGDELLRQAAKRLSERVRSSDVVARIGGDEFNVMLCELASPARITAVAQQLLGAFTRPFLVGEHTLHIDTSIGIAVFPDDADEPDALRRYADMAMYDAKRRGGNRFEFFNQDINMRSVRRVRIERDLRGAAARGELRVLFQPLVEAATGRCFSAEALVRWMHPRLGLLEPAQFLDVAEETGLITEVDEWVLHRACEEAHRWNAAADRPLAVTVNLCARQFLRPDLPALVSQSLETAGLDAQLLQLEITEQVAMDDISHALPQMHRMDELGIGLALDDFGTGYSSLSYLKRMPVSLLKIDQSFVQDIVADSEDRAIVTAITALAHKMDIAVLAEGVETEPQFALVRAARCDSAQGFYFDVPLEPERMLARAATGRGGAERRG